MSRLEPLALEEARVRAAEVGARPEAAAINLYRLMLRSPQLGRVMHEVNMLLWKGVLAGTPAGARARELVIMRMAWLQDSAYLWSHHWTPVVDGGIPGLHPPDIEHVRHWQAHPGFDEVDRLVLAATDEFNVHDRLSAATLDRLGEHFDTTEVLELVFSMVMWGGLAKLGRTAGLELEEGYESWQPDGIGPGFPAPAPAGHP